jgi:hypothetical protein
MSRRRLIRHRTDNLDVERGRRRRRRGSAYVFVLLVALLVTVIGLSALAVERIKGREGAASDDWNEAGLLAQAAVENALGVMNSTPAWRTTLANNTPSASVAMGRGSYQWKWVDEIDGDLANNAGQPVRLYGIGRVGQAVRLFSVQVAGAAGYSALQAAAYADKDMTAPSHLTAVGGPLSCAGRFTVPSSAVVTADVEAGALSNGGAIVGNQTVPSIGRTMPPSSVYDTYLAMATDIPYNNLPLAQISGKVLSAGANPFGSVNAQGIYKIDIRANTTVTIVNSRLVCTLLIGLASGATLNVVNCNLWQTPAGGYPILIVKAAGAGTVKLQGTAANLSEAFSATNFNPPSTPYNGHSDYDTIDVYPSKLDGLIHIMGPSVNTQVATLNLTHPIITEGPLTFTNDATITVDPSQAQNPPLGYSSPAMYTPAAGSWRWDVQP